MHAGNGAAIGPNHADASLAISRIINSRLGDYPSYRLLSNDLSGFGVSNLRISNSDYGIESATPEQADLIYRRLVRKQAGVVDDDQQSVLAVPPNAFTATTVTYNFAYSGGNSDKIELHWNFRDDYVNGSAPDDAAAITLQDYDYDCYFGINTWKEAYNWNSSAEYGSSHVWVESLDTKSAVFRLRDRASGFQLNIDHGFLAMSLSRYAAGDIIPPSCGGNWSQKITASTFFEHNQDGGGTWGFSVGWGLLDLTYSDSNTDSLQKAGGVSSIRW